MTKTLRSIRVRREPVLVSLKTPAETLLEIEKLMKSISNADTLVAEYTLARAENAKKLLALMRTNKVQQHIVEDVFAEVKTPMGHGTNIVDPVKYKKIVSEKDFYDSINVNITKARLYVPLKQLQSITTTIPGEAKDPIVVVKKMKNG